MYNYTFINKDLFLGMNKKLINKKNIPSRFDDERQLASEIFNYCFYLILLDIINNNVTFVLPLYCNKYSEIYIKSYKGDKFKDLYRIGKFNKIDYVLSNFTGNQLTFKYQRSNKEYKEKPIYIHGYLNKELIKNTELGKQYY